MAGQSLESAGNGPWTRPRKPIDLAVAADLDQLHRALLAWLEAHGHAAGNIQAHAVGGAVEIQTGIGFGEG
jgi:hypothetical protein